MIKLCRELCQQQVFEGVMALMLMLVLLFPMTARMQQQEWRPPRTQHKGDPRWQRRETCD
jgi:hypothetical protein